MAKRIFGNCILALLVLSILSSLTAASSRKKAALEQKVIEISALRAKIIDKIDQGIEMRIFLQKRLNELRDEIKVEQQNLSGINGYEAPLENLRINYNLNLIQHLRAYIEQLDERIAYFQAGNERLKFYLENLIGRIDTVLDEFIPETKKKIFDALDIRLMPTEQVWNEIITKPS
jgi:chromosome segregation ATPase